MRRPWLRSRAGTSSAASPASQTPSNAAAPSGAAGALLRRSEGPSKAVDNFRTLLYLLNESADTCPPLKSATGLVSAIWDVADRIAATDERARTLACRTTEILDTMHKSMDPSVATDRGALPLPALQLILDFERLLEEMLAAMEGVANRRRLHRILGLRRNESQLAQFEARLQAAANTFQTGMAIVQVVAFARNENKMDAKLTSLTSSLEQSNTELRSQIKHLKFTVVFLA